MQLFIIQQVQDEVLPHQNIKLMGQGLILFWDDLVFLVLALAGAKPPKGGTTNRKHGRRAGPTIFYCKEQTLTSSRGIVYDNLSAHIETILIINDLVMKMKSL
ncbi:MAG TPA: hypothetical protein PLP19_02025 [bacterium]|nr:hypothetical protein [bacterium]HPN42245.1 hypothetical protein [bacterium]